MSADKGTPLQEIDIWIAAVRRVQDEEIPLNGNSLIAFLQDCKTELATAQASILEMQKVNINLVKQGEQLLERAEKAEASLSVQREQVGIVNHEIAKDGKCGHVLWFKSMADLPEGTLLYAALPVSHTQTS